MADLRRPHARLGRHRLCTAPMLDWSDRHFRYFLRLISRHAFLYTEMVTTGALLHGDRTRHLDFSPAEKPVALQLGGSDAQDLACCAQMGEEYGYDEINLNVGCPSDRVRNGRFGACLMAEPELVAECVAAMRSAVSVPVTVKTRIGIDQRDSYENLADFVATVSSAGCATFIIHARKAWLSGLSPKENREIPPLRYDVVEQIKRDFPAFEIVLNGGITTLGRAEKEVSRFDGVMLGREVYNNPYILAEVDRRFFADDHPVPSRREVVEAFAPYVVEQLDAGQRLHSLTRHILGLFHGEPGARNWRRHLSEKGRRHDADQRVLLEAVNRVPQIREKATEILG
ncbi:MAG: tRNA dihydrouridine(20/20a) synthase DusA [Pseudomonadota bacterium]